MTSKRRRTAAFLLLFRQRSVAVCQRVRPSTGLSVLASVCPDDVADRSSDVTATSSPFRYDVAQSDARTRPTTAFTDARISRACGCNIARHSWTRARDIQPIFLGVDPHSDLQAGAS